MSHSIQSTKFFLIIKDHLAPLGRARLCLAILTDSSQLPPHAVHSLAVQFNVLCISAQVLQIQDVGTELLVLFITRAIHVFLQLCN